MHPGRCARASGHERRRWRWISGALVDRREDGPSDGRVWDDGADADGPTAACAPQDVHLEGSP